MWVVVVNDSISEHRDSRISDLFGNVNSEKFISKGINSTKYSTTKSLLFAIIYKNKSMAEKFINSYNSNHSSHYNSIYHYIQDKFLHCREITIEEWNFIMDYKIQKLESKYIRAKEKLETKKNQYR